jgi:uroporphyrin-III C-methyltransferase
VTGSVHLVGAGPGDPDLLTVRALRLLERAEVVAYDELVSPAILALAAPDAELLPVGRRRGQGTVPYRVHPLVIDRALAGLRVVRLKTGDPFVFGRGGEELEELAEHGIHAEVVPGITAALGAAAATGIPLTHRGVASAVTFVTGHDGVAAVASLPSSCTLVLYMAAHGLARCVDDLVAAGRSPHTPAAIIAAATTPSQRVIAGTLGDLADRGHEVGADPALVVVGDVVALGAATAVIASQKAAHAAPDREVA